MVSIPPRIITAIKNILAIFTLIVKEIIMAKIRLAGALIHILKIIWYEFCTLVTSVVSLVTRPAVLNLSILEKENVCILLYIPSLRFLANPAEALAPYLPPISPAKSPTRAAINIMPPTIRICLISLFSIPSSTRDAIR